jgi:multicomponent Na+:H+ antiporter subunit G
MASEGLLLLLLWLLLGLLWLLLRRLLGLLLWLLLGMLLGLLLRIPQQWPLICLALLGLVVWNTIFGYVLARCSLGPHSNRESNP